MKNLIAEPVRPGDRFALVGVGAGAVLVGGLVLLGWALDVAALKSVLPGWVAMKPNTAVAFILIGLAVLFSRPPSAFRLPPWSPSSPASAAGSRA